MNKRYVVTFLLLALVSSLCFYILNSENKNSTHNQQFTFTEPSERFVGTVGGDAVIFEQKDYRKYRLEVNGKVRVGNLNTERGFGDDIDATVYILNWDKVAIEQEYYVRLTKDQKHLQFLDSDRKVMPGAFLVKEQ